MDVKNKEGIEYLNNDVEDGSVDLIITDPPYIISKDTGMNKHYNTVKKNQEDNVKYVKNKRRKNSKDNNNRIS